MKRVRKEDNRYTQLCSSLLYDNNEDGEDKLIRKNSTKSQWIGFYKYINLIIMETNYDKSE